MACNGVDIQSPVHTSHAFAGCGHEQIFARRTFSLTSGTSQSGSHYMAPLSSPSTSLLYRTRSGGIDKERTTTRRLRIDTANCGRRANGRERRREGAGVIVLQNNLNFNYFAELQKRRCDSLTVCHRKINWLLLLPLSSRFDRVSSAYESSFSHTHARIYVSHISLLIQADFK